MKRLALFIMLLSTIICAVSCVNHSETVSGSSLSDAVVPDSTATPVPELSLEQKIISFGDYGQLRLDTASESFLSAEAAKLRFLEIMSGFFTDGIKDAIDYDFDLSAFIAQSSNVEPVLCGSSEAAFFCGTVILKGGTDHFGVSIYFEAVTGTFLKIEFEGKMFNPKDITEDEQELFVHRFEELSGFAVTQDAGTSDITKFSRQVMYHTNKRISLSVYIDKGFFTIYYGNSKHDNY